VIWNLADIYLKLNVTIHRLGKYDLCHKCGTFYENIITHIVLECSYTLSVRDELWCDILNITDIMFSVYLHSLSNFEMIHVILGGNINYELPSEDEDEFRIKCVVHLYRMIKLYYN